MKQVIDRRLAVVGAVLYVLGLAVGYASPSDSPILSTVPGFIIHTLGAGLIVLAVLKE
jgi:hypothetical protein